MRDTSHELAPARLEVLELSLACVRRLVERGVVEGGGEPRREEVQDDRVAEHTCVPRRNHDDADCLAAGAQR